MTNFKSELQALRAQLQNKLSVKTENNQTKMSKTITLKYTFSIALLLSLLLGCSKDKVYNVPDNLQSYIDDFIEEAASRGIELTVDDLVILFEEDLMVNGVSAAGLCQTGGRKHTPTIKIDTTSLNWTLNLSTKEQLIFHELGHCVLGRAHNDRRLGNSNYASSMRTSGEQIYGPVYSNFKRDYYLDELFVESTPEPEWAVNLFNYSNIAFASKTLIYEELFDAPGNGWSVGTSVSTNRQIADGEYKLTILNEGSYFVSNQIEIDSTQNFDLEIRLTVSPDGFIGMLWGGLALGPVGQLPSYNTFYVGREVTTIGSILHGSESSYQYNNYIITDFNKLTIRRIDNDFIYYLNERQIDNMKFVQINGKEFGIAFGGDANAQFRIDDIRLFYF